jgi:hypothetical protein
MQSKLLPDEARSWLEKEPRGPAKGRDKERRRRRGEKRSLV